MSARDNRSFGKSNYGAMTLCALVMAGALGLSAGCSVIPEGRSDPAHFFVLSTSANARPATRGADGSAPSVRLRPVELATYLRGRPLIVRRGDNEIEFREFARWGEALELGIARVVREELLARGAARSVLSSRREQGTAADVALSIRVLACEGLADGGVAFRAAWEISPATSGAASPSPLAALLRGAGTKPKTPSVNTTPSGNAAKQGTAEGSVGRSDAAAKPADGGGGNSVAAGKPEAGSVNSAESPASTPPAVATSSEKEKPTEPLASGEFRAEHLRWDAKSDASLAAALSQAVDALAGEIAGALAKDRR